MLTQKEAWSGWPTLPLTTKLRTLVEHAPVRTQTKDGTPSDVTNLMFLGTREFVRANVGSRLGQSVALT